MKGSQMRGKSPGWAAFDRKQRQKQGLVPEVSTDPYPPLPGSCAPCNFHGNLPRTDVFSTKSFAAVLLPSGNFEALTEKVDCNKLAQVHDSGGDKGIEGNTRGFVVKALKEVHGWADDSLIEDAMTSVNNDIDKVSTLLRGMVPSKESVANKETQDNSTHNDFNCDKRILTDGLSRETTNLGAEIAADIADLSSTIEDVLKHNEQKLRDQHSACGLKHSDDSVINMKFILSHLKSVPIEPEWEEDNVYLSQRKDALRMMRLASQHSRAATNAFLRGDHFVSKQYSLKAQEEWLAAERLNAKAAKEILIIRNSEHDPWKLDLHGLHVAEALQALKKHLLKIETQVLMNRHGPPNRLKTKNGIKDYSSVGTFNRNDAANLDKQQTAFRQRPVSIQVITGIAFLLLRCL
uniref:Uncharacterized protein MANES_13G155500 n=1 Tax=Rhizophora mucronata TaxID=61149 RepID=A0A2P2JYD2_RHIMU